VDFSKLLPFVVFILIGIVAARRFGVDKASFAKVLLYFVAPIVFFETTWGSNLTAQSLALPLVITLIASMLAIAAFYVSRKFMGSPDANLLGFAMGSSNSGYFGLPVAAALYGTDFLPQMILVVMGFSIYEYTTGFYITARSSFSVKNSIQKLFAVPVIYAFALGLCLNWAGIERAEWMGPLSSYLRGAYSFMGLMVLGLGLADISWKTFDLKFLLRAFVSRFIAWPVAMAVLIVGLQLKPTDLWFKSLALVAFLPMAANGVVIATELKTSPHKIAGAIAVSTIASLIALNLGVHTKFISWVAGFVGAPL
jgi:malate permease and related proteins